MMSNFDSRFPVQNQPVYEANPYQPSPLRGGVPVKLNRLAVTSVVMSGLSVLGLVIFFAGVGFGIVFWVVTPIVGALLGHVALGEIRRTGEGGKGAALTGLILGWSALGLQAAFVVVGFVIIVSLGASMM